MCAMAQNFICLALLEIRRLLSALTKKSVENNPSEAAEKKSGFQLDPATI